MTDKFDEAARKAMLSSAAFPDRFTLARKMSVNDILQTLSDEGGKSDDYLLDFAVKIEPIIAKHFAELKATHEKLVELAVATKLHRMATKNIEVEEALSQTNYGIDIDPIAYIGVSEGENWVDAILNDPLVVAAIERSKA